MSWFAVGAVVVSAAGTAYSANKQAKSQKQATNANLQSARETNELNERLWRESRGSGGSALLPTYLSPYESALGSDAAELAKLGMDRGRMSLRMADIQSGIDSMAPALGGSTRAINDLFSGNMLGNRLAALAPIRNARTSAAKTRFDSISQSLDETIGRLNALNARRGFLGGSSFDNNQLFGSTLQTRQSAADALASAQLQNAQDESAIRENDQLMRLQSVSLPYEHAQRLAALRELPLSAVSAGASQALAPLNFFRMGQSTWQASPLPEVKPIMSNGQIIGQGVASLGSALGGYFANRSLAREYGQMGGGWGG